MRKSLFTEFILVVTGFSIVLFASVSDAQERTVTLTIDQAVELALVENRDLAAARIRVEEATGRLTQAGLLPNPALESDFGTDFVFSDEGERNFSAGIFQPLPLSGRIGAQKAAARVDIKRTFANIADLERLLVRDVRHAFITLLSFNEQLKLQETLIGLNSELIKGIRAGIKEGLTSERDLNAVAIALQQARAEKEVLAAQRKSVILQLNKLVGKPPTFSFAPEGKLQYEPPEGLTDYSVEKAFSQRPDLKLAELTIELARAEIGLAKALRFEDITAGVSYQYERQVLEIPQGNFPNTDNLIGFSLTIPLPLFDRKQGLIAEARARERRAEQSAGALKLLIGQEVNDALNRVTALSALLESYLSGILKTAQDNVGLVEDGFKQGLVGIVDVIQSRRQFASLTSSYIDAVRDYQIALSDLRIAAGAYPTTIKVNKEKEDKNR